MDSIVIARLWHPVRGVPLGEQNIWTVHLRTVQARVIPALLGIPLRVIQTLDILDTRLPVIHLKGPVVLLAIGRGDKILKTFSSLALIINFEHIWSIRIGYVTGL